MSWNNRLGKISKGWKLKSILYGGVASPSYNRGRIIESKFTKSESGAITRVAYPKVDASSRKGLYVSAAGIGYPFPGVHIKDR